MRKLGKSWIDSFMLYHEKMELPENFIFWSAVSCIAAILKRNVFFKRMHYTVYPNMYIILVSPPGVGKGSSLMKVREFLSASGSVNLLEGRIIAQKLFERVSKGFSNVVSAPAGLLNPTSSVHITIDRSCVIFSTELPVLLEDNDKLLPYFCDVWDMGRHDYDTKSSGYQKIENAGQSIIGACTPTFIKKLGKSHGTEAILGGFVSRCIFTLQVDKKPTNDFWGEHKHIATPIPDDDFVNDLKHIASLRGEAMFSEKARKLFSAYIKMKEKNRDEYESELMASFHARLWSHVGKTALALSVSRSDSLIIEEDDLIGAIKALEVVEDNLEKTFGLVGEGDHAECVYKVQCFIEKKGVTTKSEILRHLWRIVTLAQLDLILAQLDTMGFCIISAGSRTNSVKITHNPAYLQKKGSVINP